MAIKTEIDLERINRILDSMDLLRIEMMKDLSKLKYLDDYRIISENDNDIDMSIYRMKSFIKYLMGYEDNI